jgi:hypothetical protein
MGKETPETAAESVLVILEQNSQPEGVETEAG